MEGIEKRDMPKAISYHYSSSTVSSLYLCCIFYRVK